MPCIIYLMFRQIDLCGHIFLFRFQTSARVCGMVTIAQSPKVKADEADILKLTWGRFKAL